jgi:general secretion pathway protein G
MKMGERRGVAIGLRVAKRRQRGLTLIEMMVVVTIIAMFGALVLPRFLGRTDAARQTAAKTQINGFLTALGAYKLDTGNYPPTELGLGALRTKPPNANNWQGPYLPQDVPNDPWGNGYAYRYPGEHGDEPDIICFGSDGQQGGEGIASDISSWKN